MKALNIYLYILLFILPIHSLAQTYEFPIRIIDYNGSGIIELVGGDHDFIVLCLQSDLGKGVFEEYVDEKSRIGSYNNNYNRYFEKRIWKNIIKKEWSNNKITLSITYSTGLHPDYGEYTSMEIPYLQIECKDSNGKDLLIGENSKSRLAILDYFSKKILYNYAIVNSSNGLNVRKEPSLSSDIIYKLRDQTKVVLLGKSDKSTIVKKGDSMVQTQWSKVYINSNTTGYVANVFLIPWFGIHPKSLTKAFDVYYTHYLSKARYQYTSKQYYNIYGEEMPPEKDPKEVLRSMNDSIYKFLKVESVDINKYKNRKIDNRFTLDTCKIGVLTKPTSGYVSDSSHSIKLPINGGMDSIHIQDMPSEFSTSKIYIGRIPFFNQYLIHSYSFGDDYSLISSESGEYYKPGFEGIPYVAPDGKHIIDFKHFSDPEGYDDPHFTILSISRIDKAYNTIDRFTVFFSDWLVVETPNSAFWISDNELIIQVYPIQSLNLSSSITDFEVFNGKAEYKDYQYIKITIK